MNQSIALYKTIVDALANLGRGVYRNWVIERGFWPQLPKNEAINDFLNRLNQSDKEVLVNLLEEARDGGIHDTLAFFNDKISVDGLKIVENDVEMAQEPFGTELYYDWVCRREGDPWPSEEE